jgi:hypothetical protein
LSEHTILPACLPAWQIDTDAASSSGGGARGGQQAVDSLDFTRQKNVTKNFEASKYEIVKLNCYAVAITGIVIAHRSNNNATGM